MIKCMRNKGWLAALLLAAAATCLLASAGIALAADDSGDGSYYYVTTDSGVVVKKQVNNNTSTGKNDSNQDYITLTTDTGQVIKRPVSSVSNSASTKNYLGDNVLVSRTMLEKNKIDLANMNMRGSSSEKMVLIEKAALEYAAQKNMTIGIDTNFTRVEFSAKAFVDSTEFTAAGNSSSGFNLIIELDDVKGLNNSRDLPSADQAKLGAKPVSAEGVGLNIYFRGSNNTYTYINELAAPVRLQYYYLTNYRGVNRPAPEQTLALAWVDCDRRVQSYKTVNALLASRVDTENQIVEVYSPYACGAYVLVTEANVDNRKTVLEGGQSETAAGLAGGVGAVNTKTVPAWAADSVAVLQTGGVVPSDLTGVAYTLPITRGEFAAYLVRTLKLSTSGTALTGKNAFVDVKENNPYYTEILTAAANGLVAGKSADTFEPNAGITRQEMAVLFNRALQQAKVDFSIEESKLAAMSDADKVADWAKGGVAACLNGGLIAGKEGNRFAPQDTTTWTEAVVMLARLYNVVSK